MRVGIPQNNNYKQGFYKLKNPEKYKGDMTQIVYRSSWEYRAFKYMDDSPHVLKWSSEEIVVIYESPVDNKPHRYFIDLYAEIKVGDKIVTYLVEIKPAKKLKEPTRPKRITENYVNQVCEYGVNTAKWRAAREYCRKKGWIFKIMTEHDINF
jgi:hypothetical protein